MARWAVRGRTSESLKLCNVQTSGTRRHPKGVRHAKTLIRKMPPCLLAATSLRSLEVRHSSALMRSAIDSMRSVSDFPHPHLLIFLCFTVTHLVTLRTAGRFVVSTQWLCQIGYMYLLLLVGTHAFHEGGRISIMLQVVPRLQYILSVYRCLFACNVLFGCSCPVVCV